MVALKDFIHRFKDRNYLVQHNKQYHRKVLLSTFHFIQTQRLEQHCTVQLKHHKKACQEAFFEWSHLKISPADSKI